MEVWLNWNIITMGTRPSVGTRIALTSRMKKIALMTIEYRNGQVQKLEGVAAKLHLKQLNKEGRMGRVRTVRRATGRILSSTDLTTIFCTNWVPVTESVKTELR